MPPNDSSEDRNIYVYNCTKIGRVLKEFVFKSACIKFEVVKIELSSINKVSLV